MTRSKSSYQQVIATVAKKHTESTGRQQTQRLVNGIADRVLAEIANAAKSGPVRTPLGTFRYVERGGGTVRAPNGGLFEVKPRRALTFLARPQLRKLDP